MLAVGGGRQRISGEEEVGGLFQTNGGETREGRTGGVSSGVWPHTATGGHGMAKMQGAAVQGHHTGQ